MSSDKIPVDHGKAFRLNQGMDRNQKIGNQPMWNKQAKLAPEPAYCYVLQSMADIKTITGRDLRREAVEEQLRPGERVRIAKQNGKVFELRRMDTSRKNLNESLGELLEEMPPSGGRMKVDAVKMLLEDRE